MAGLHTSREEGNEGGGPTADRRRSRKVTAGTTIQGVRAKKGAKYLSSPEGGTTIPDASGDGQVYQLEPVRYLRTRADRDRDLRVVRAS